MIGALRAWCKIVSACRLRVLSVRALGCVPAFPPCDLNTNLECLRTSGEAYRFELQWLTDFSNSCLLVLGLAVCYVLSGPT